MQTVQTVQKAPDRRQPKDRLTVARKMLRRLGAHLVAHSDDPAADPRTMAEQARQTAGLVLLELDDG